MNGREECKKKKSLTSPRDELRSRLSPSELELHVINRLNERRNSRNGCHTRIAERIEKAKWKVRTCCSKKVASASVSRRRFEACGSESRLNARDPNANPASPLHGKATTLGSTHSTLPTRSWLPGRFLPVSSSYVQWGW